MYQFIQRIFDAIGDKSPIDLNAETHFFSDHTHLQSSEASDLFLQAICATDDSEKIQKLGMEAACTFSPIELKELYEHIERAGLRVPVDVFRRVAPFWVALNRRDIKLPKFENISISTHARLFVAKDFISPKGLLIVFTCMSGRVEGSYCRLLTRIPSGLDVLFVRRLKGGDYRSGVPGFGNGFMESCHGMEKVITTGQYQGVGCLGTSMGGFWAIRAAMNLRANVGVSLSGRYFPQRLAISRYGEDSEVDSINPLQLDQSTRLYCFFGDKAMNDVRDAERFRSRVPSVSLVPLKGHTEHNTLTYLHSRRELNMFFSTLYKAVMGENVVFPQM